MWVWVMYVLYNLHVILLFCSYASVRMRKRGIRLCVCRLLQLLKDQRSASKSFYRLLVTVSWILRVLAHNNKLITFNHKNADSMAAIIQANLFF